jgi:short-subunit dehydrogenase
MLLEGESFDLEKDMESFSGKVVWITGASSGMGEGMAKAFSAMGAKVVLSARNTAELNRVKDECLSGSGISDNLLVLPFDVADFDALPEVYNKVIENFSHLDILINNAGLGARDFAIDTDMSVYRKIMDVNLFSAIALSKLVLPGMIDQGSGRIVGVSSMAGKIGVPLRTAYCPAKHAVLGFFDALRAEVAFQGIKVNVLVPGVVRTGAVANALKGNGEPIGAEDGAMQGGLSVDEAMAIFITGLLENLDEIEAAVEGESQMMKMKREDPLAVFRFLERSAEQELYKS